MALDFDMGNSPITDDEEKIIMVGRNLFAQSIEQDADFRYAILDLAGALGVTLPPEVNAQILDIVETSFIMGLYAGLMNTDQIKEMVHGTKH